MSDFELTPEEMKLFLEESEEQLATMEESLVALERDPANVELVQLIFRAAHTLKGGAATAGFDDIARLTHSMESLLDLVRQGKRELTAELADYMLDAVDLLKHGLSSVGSGAMEPELKQTYDDFIRRLEQAESEFAAVEQPEMKQPKIGALTLSPEVQQLVQQRRLAGDTIYAWHVQLAEEAQMPAVRAYQVMLTFEEHGYVLHAEPSLKTIEEEQVETGHLRVVLATSADPSELQREVLHIADVASADWQPLMDQDDKIAASGESQKQKQKTDRPNDVGTGSGGSKPETAARRAPAPSGSSGLGNTVRVDVHVLDILMNLVGELVIERTRLARLGSEDLSTDMIREELGQVSGQLNRITTDLQDAIMQVRMVPLDTLFRKFPRMMRDLSRQLGKPLQFDVSGEETELDRSVIELIGDPLIHILRNAIDHGVEDPETRKQLGKPETGRIQLTAAHRENHIYISVEDDGKGLDPAKLKQVALKKGLITEEQAERMSRTEALNLIFMPGFTTADEVSSVSGRGVGTDVVKSNIERVNGSIEVDSQVGVGTRFTIKLPLTLAILHALMVEIAGVVYALPLSNVIEAVRVRDEETDLASGWRLIPVRGEMVPLLNPGEIWGSENHVPWNTDQANQVVILQSGTDPIGLIVDKLLGEQEVVMKSMGKVIGEVAGVSGASILGDGRVALIIDVAGITKLVRQLV